MADNTKGLGIAGSLGVSAGTSLLNTIGDLLTGSSSQERQLKAQEDYLDYYMGKYGTTKRQVEQVTEAGLNPAAIFGNNAPQVMNPSGGQVSPLQWQGIGTTSMTDLAQYLAGVAQAKKAGVEIPNVEEDTRSKVLDNARKEFENDLLKRYGLQKSAAELALAEENVRLAAATTDVKKQEKALMEWQAAKEKALSECSEKQRDLLQKELDNKDTAIQLVNELEREKIKTEKSQQGYNYAAASNQSASAEQTRIFNKFYKDRRYQHSFMSQVIEQGREAVSKRLVTQRQAEQLEYLVEQAAYSNDMKEFTYWSGQVNQFVNTIGSAASQFYGAGALRELIELRKAQQLPPPSIRGFTP